MWLLFVAIVLLAHTNADASSAQVYVSTGDKSKLFERQPDIPVRATGSCGLGVKANFTCNGIFTEVASVTSISACKQAACDAGSPVFRYKSPANGNQGCFIGESNGVCRNETGWYLGYISTNAGFTSSESVQVMQGYGAALTDTSATLLSKFPDVDKFIDRMFNTTSGAGISLVRVPMGMSDFSTSLYTYDDNDSLQNTTLPNFSIQHDETAIIPLLRKMKNVNPKLKILVSSWTPPVWMKTSNARGSGSLMNSTEAYSAYALYLQKAVLAYEAKGLTIDFMTMQNEPLHTNCGDMPCMSMSADEQIRLAAIVGPLLEQTSSKTKLFAYDHNWDHPEYPLAVLSNDTVRKYFAGIAFHCYGGTMSTAQDQVYQQMPDTTMLATECSGGDWAPKFSDNLMWSMDNWFAGNAIHYGSGSIFWNMCLDENHGPKTQEVGGCMNCRGVTTINTTATTIADVTFNEEYYDLIHLSRFVPAGSVRYNTTTSDDTVKAVMFEDVVNQKAVVVAYNMKPKESNPLFFKFKDEMVDNIILPSKSIFTITWDLQQSG